MAGNANVELLASVKRGQAIDIRMTTLLHGLLKQAQAAVKAGTSAFGQYVTQVQNQIPEFANAVAPGHGGAQYVTATLLWGFVAESQQAQKTNFAAWQAEMTRLIPIYCQAVTSIAGIAEAGGQSAGAGAKT
jgi:hypothetical protein